MRLEDELKMSGFANSRQRTFLNIIFTSCWLTDKMSARMKNADISDQQYNVLRILRGQKGIPVNLMDIQDRMIHRMSNATRLVEKLRKKGLVERELCEQNRRKVEIVITTTGLELLQKLDPLVALDEENALSNLNRNELKTMDGLLDKLRG